MMNKLIMIIIISLSCIGITISADNRFEIDFLGEEKLKEYGIGSTEDLVINIAGQDVTLPAGAKAEKKGSEYVITGLNSPITIAGKIISGIESFRVGTDGSMLIDKIGSDGNINGVSISDALNVRVDSSGLITGIAGDSGTLNGVPLAPKTNFRWDPNAKKLIISNDGESAIDISRDIDSSFSGTITSTDNKGFKMYIPGQSGSVSVEGELMFKEGKAYVSAGKEVTINGIKIRKISGKDLRLHLYEDNGYSSKELTLNNNEIYIFHDKIVARADYARITFEETKTIDGISESIILGDEGGLDSYAIINLPVKESLKKGDQGNPVRHAQKRLNIHIDSVNFRIENGHIDGATAQKIRAVFGLKQGEKISHLDIDGIFDENTEKAIKAMQIFAGQNPDGLYKDNPWDKGTLTQFIDGKIRSPEIGYTAEKVNGGFKIDVDPSRVSKSRSIVIMGIVDTTLKTNMDGTRVSITSVTDTGVRFDNNIITSLDIDSSFTRAKMELLWNNDDFPRLGELIRYNGEPEKNLGLKELRDYYLQNIPPGLTNREKMLYAVSLYDKAIIRDREDGIEHTYNVNEDCSATVRNIAYVAGIKLPDTTHTMLTNTPMEYELTSFKMDNLAPGDVIVTKKGQGHAVIYLGVDDKGCAITYQSTSSSNRGVTSMGEFQGPGYYQDCKRLTGNFNVRKVISFA
jgi:peptidoglycan hydrolase-like protein with peptidoglycan-binding domain